MRRLRRFLGFTLIELLVVIAIIAILAAILFPTYTTARRAAKSTMCQTHEKELLVALMLYTEAYGGRLPRCQFLTDAGVGGLGTISLYRPYVKNLQIIICPEVVIDLQYREVRHQAYAYNQQCLCDIPDGFALGMSGMKSIYDVYETQRSVDKFRGRLLSTIAKTSRCPAFFCSRSHHGGGRTRNGYGWQCADSLNGYRMVNAHNGGINYAFLDGHVKWFLPNGGVFYVRTEGIDYDGNGTVGAKDFMR